MSGKSWIDAAPTHWDRVRFSKVYSFFRGLDIKKQDLSDHGLPVISYGQIHAKDNSCVRISSTQIRYIPEEFVKKSQMERSLLKTGDVVFADTSEDIEGVGNMTRASGVDTLYAGYHTLVARPKPEFSHEYMAYQMASPGWRQQIQRAVQGVKVYSITQRIFGGVAILRPPVEEQQAIVQFLDFKTAEIDRLIEKMAREVELLERYRRELIARTVTRGLDPDAPMRDSGVDWIGQTPEHWVKLPFLAILRPEYAANDRPDLAPPLQFKDGQIVKKPGWEDLMATQQELLSAYKLVRPGMIVVNGLNLNYDFKTKRVGLVTSFGSITSAYIVLKVLGNNNSSYITYLLKAMDSRLIFHGMAEGVRKILSWSDIRRQLLVIPPVEEQQRIAKFIEEKSAQIDSVIEGVNKQIELLGKYRKQIINDAVTGKVRVGDAA